MCNELEKMCDEVREQTQKKVTKEAVKKMLRNPKYTNEDIKEIYEITDEEIENIREEILVK